MHKKEICIMIQKVYDILGMANPTILEENIIMIFCLALLFFGVLVVFNSLLSIISNVLKID